jgi:hypothetical protein
LSESLAATNDSALPLAKVHLLNRRALCAGGCQSSSGALFFDYFRVSSMAHSRIVKNLLYFRDKTLQGTQRQYKAANLGTSA